MNEDHDLECTCDVGPFTSCPVCRARQSPDGFPGREKRKPAFDARVDTPVEDYVARVKAGAHWK